MSPGFLLGFDGGGTKTAAVLADLSGRILARSRVAGCAIIGAPHPAAAEVMRAVCRALCTQAGIVPQEILAAGIGLNGIDFADEFEAQLAGVAAALELPEARVTLVNDGIPALWGAPGVRHYSAWHRFHRRLAFSTGRRAIVRSSQ